MRKHVDVVVTCISSFLSSSMYLCVCSCSCLCSVFIGTLILTLSFLLWSKYKHITTSEVTQSNFIQCQVYMAITLLAVDIDNALNFSGHISNICKESSQRVGVINRLRNLIPQKAKLQLFKGAILPHSTYCSTVWNFCRASDSRKLERVQERAIYCDSNSTYPVLLQRAKLPTLYNRRLQDIAILTYKIKNGLCPNYISRLFIFRSNQYNL